jgi:hypothetical protein
MGKSFLHIVNLFDHIFVIEYFIGKQLNENLYVS